MRTIRPLGKAAPLASATVLAAVLLSSLPVAGFGQVNLSQAAKRTMLFFPFDVSGSNVPGKDDVSSLLSDVARSRIIASETYSVVQFHRALAPVARLHNDQVLSDSDVSSPFAEDNTKSVKVAKAVGYDVTFVGSVDDYSYAEGDKQASMTVSGRFVEVATGKIIKSATVSAQSSKGGTGKEPEKALEAARAAGDKLMGQLVTVTSQIRDVQPTKTMQKTPPPPKTPGKRHSRNDWIFAVLAVGLGLGIGLAAGGGGGGGGAGGGGGGGGSDFPPARPGY